MKGKGGEGKEGKGRWRGKEGERKEGKEEGRKEMYSTLERTTKVNKEEEKEGLKDPLKAEEQKN